MVSDLGGEFDNAAMQQFAAEQGIAHEFRAPEDHVQRAERANRTIYDSVRPMLQEANAPDNLWLDAGLCMANASNEEIRPPVEI